MEDSKDFFPQGIKEPHDGSLALGRLAYAIETGGDPFNIEDETSPDDDYHTI
jgi:hypothetical protein